MNLSFTQKKMLKAALTSDNGPWGYAPCGPGFKRTMQSLVKLKLAFATGSEFNIRGIILTKQGREIATNLK